MLIDHGDTSVAKKLQLYAPGGTQIWERDRSVRLKPQNPYPSLRVILAEKGIHF